MFGFSTLHSIGIGVSDSSRKNAVEVMEDGRMFVKGVGNYDGTDPEAEGVRTIQEMLSVLPEGEQNQRDLMDLEETTLLQAVILKNLAPLLYSGTVGYCEYRKGSLSSTSEFTNTVDKICYYPFLNKIYALKEETVYRDWIVDGDVSPYCFQNRDFLATSTNTPIEGKIYLMKMEDGSHRLYLYESGGLTLLLDTVGLLGLISVSETNNGSINISSDVCIYTVSEEANPHHIYISLHTDKDGKSTKVFIKNTLEVAQAFYFFNRGDSGKTFHVSGPNIFIVPPHSVALVEVTQKTIDEDHSEYYWSYITPKGNSVFEGELGNDITIPLGTDVANLTLTTSTKAHEIELPQFFPEGSSMLINLDFPAGVTSNVVSINTVTMVAGTDYGDSFIRLNSSTGERCSVLLTKYGNTVYGSVIRNINVNTSASINVLGDYKVAESSYDINFYKDITVKEVRLYELNDMKPGTKTKVIITGDSDYYSINLSNFFDQWTVLYPNGNIAFKSNGVAVIDCMCIGEKIMMFDVHNTTNATVHLTSSELSDVVELVPFIKYVIDDAVTGTLKIKRVKIAGIMPVEEYYLYFKTGESAVRISLKDTGSPAWGDYRDIAANTEVLYRSSNGFITVDTNELS